MCVYVCLCMGLCTCMWVPVEARRGRCIPTVELCYGCEPPDWQLNLEPTVREVGILNY